MEGEGHDKQVSTNAPKYEPLNSILLQLKHAILVYLDDSSLGPVKVYDDEYDEANQERHHHGRERGSSVA